ncbi:MAG: serine/threonine protein kinase, partial [Deltaproteobacteria bacterium]
MKLPQQFGKYLLLERVSVGGMAEVFKAKSFGVEGFEKLVAIKRILPNIAEDEDFITMFIDEAKIAVQLNHANIAQIFDLGRIDESYFIALEFVHGKDLRTIWDRHRRRGLRIPIPMSAYIMARVCEGLDYAHRKRDAAGRHLNIVHRDVSPQNVLISYEGEVKIIDFGIAKAANKASKTQAGILKGKFGYMSPEQVRGLPLDCRSDVFSAGIVLYELLTGERLFVADSDFATLEKIRKVDILPPRTYNQKIPEELERIVLKALSKDPDDRFQTAYDMQEELQRFLIASGRSFSRKDLANYMKKAFRGDIAREQERNKQYEKATMPTQPGGDEPSQVTVPEHPGPKAASRQDASASTSRTLVERPDPAEAAKKLESVELASLEEDDEDIETVVWDARAAMDGGTGELTPVPQKPAVQKPVPPPLPGAAVVQGLSPDFNGSSENTVPGASLSVSDGFEDTATGQEWSPFDSMEEDAVTASGDIVRPAIRSGRRPALKIVILVLAVMSLGVFSFAAFRVAKKKGWLGGKAELVLRTQHRGLEILVDGKRIIPEVSEGEGGLMY